jgi:hypothetical protein
MDELFRFNIFEPDATAEVVAAIKSFRINRHIVLGPQAGRFEPVRDAIAERLREKGRSARHA